jgi:hypothetical protein
MNNEQLLNELKDYIIDSMIEVYVSRSHNIDTKDIPQHYLELGEEIRLVKENNEVGSLIENILNGAYEEYEIDKPDLASILKQVLNYTPGGYK